MRTLLLLMGLMIVTSMQGCVKDLQEEATSIELISAMPSDGGQIPPQGSVTFSFSAKIKSLIINGVPIEKVEGTEGRTFVFDIERFNFEPGPITLNVAWTDDDGEMSSTILHYTVVDLSTHHPKLVSSNPPNQANVDPTSLNTDGIRLLFTEPVAIKELTLHVTADGQELQWRVAPDSEDQNAVHLLPSSSNEFVLGQTVEIRLENVRDLAGNELMPNGVVELRFTTAHK